MRPSFRVDLHQPLLHRCVDILPASLIVSRLLHKYLLRWLVCAARSENDAWIYQHTVVRKARNAASISDDHRQRYPATTGTEGERKPIQYNQNSLGEGGGRLTWHILRRRQTPPSMIFPWSPRSRCRAAETLTTTTQPQQKIPLATREWIAEPALRI